MIQIFLTNGRVKEPATDRNTFQTITTLPVPCSASEQQAGYFSELGGMLSGGSVCSGQDFSLTIQGGGTAVLQFCRQISSAGVGQDARVMNEIDATLKQFSTINHVRVLNREGQCLFDLSGLNRC